MVLFQKHIVAIGLSLFLGRFLCGGAEDSTAVHLSGGPVPPVDWYGWYVYPQVFDCLKGSLDSIEKAEPDALKAALALSAPNERALVQVSAAKRSIDSARHALFCLTYYSNAIGDHGLDEAGEIRFAWVDRTSVKKLLERAHEIFGRKGIPQPKTDEFKTPDLPPFPHKQN